MSATEQKQCSDCGQSLNRIQMIDKIQTDHTHLEYAAGEAKANWMGKFPIEGRIASYMCGQCGRITLYGEPKPE